MNTGSFTPKNQEKLSKGWGPLLEGGAGSSEKGRMESKHRQIFRSTVTHA